MLNKEEIQLKYKGWDIEDIISYIFNMIDKRLKIEDKNNNIQSKINDIEYRYNKKLENTKGYWWYEKYQEKNTELLVGVLCNRRYDRERAEDTQLKMWELEKEKYDNIKIYNAIHKIKDEMDDKVDKLREKFLPFHLPIDIQNEIIYELDYLYDILYPEGYIKLNYIDRWLGYYNRYYNKGWKHKYDTETIHLIK